jgi:hypothetical protein
MRWRFAVGLAALGLLAGCEVVRDFNAERYSRNNALGEAWLSDQMFPPEISIAGNWQAAGWGRAFFAQTDNKVRGYLGDYPVEGVVSGKKAHLLVSQGGWYYYSVVLEMPAPDILIGYYSRSVPYQTDRRVDIRLDRKPLP